MDSNSSLPPRSDPPYDTPVAKVTAWKAWSSVPASLVAAGQAHLLSVSLPSVVTWALLKMGVWTSAAWLLAPPQATAAQRDMLWLARQRESVSLAENGLVQHLIVNVSKF